MLNNGVYTAAYSLHDGPNQTDKPDKTDRQVIINFYLDLLRLFYVMEKDFIRQQIDVKRQCFYVNDLKMVISIYFLEYVSLYMGPNQFNSWSIHKIKMNFLIFCILFQYSYIFFEQLICQNFANQFKFSLDFIF